MACSRGEHLVEILQNERAAELAPATTYDLCVCVLSDRYLRGIPYHGYIPDLL